MAYRVTIPGKKETEMGGVPLTEVSLMCEGPVIPVIPVVQDPPPSPLPGETGASRPASVRLDPTTVREVLGPKPDEHDVAILRLDVLAAVAWLEAEIQTGMIGQQPLLVRGRPLGDWLNLGTIAGLLKLGQTR
jgi:hypothetical protein